MATSTDIFCGPCDAQHITKPADQWCPECEEGLCSDCQRHHSSSKATRKHKIIPIECYQQIPTLVSEIEDTCQEHDLKYSMYCPHHDDICCPLCVTVNHGKCTDLKAISELTKNAKTSALISSMEERLQEIVRLFNTALENVNINISTVKQERLICMNEISQLRNKINVHLDVLEENMIKELSKAEEKANTQLEKVKTEMCIKTQKCEELGDSLLAIKKYGSDIQAFYGGRKIKSEVEREEKILKSISEDNSLKEKHIEGRIDDKLSNILGLKTFGTITTKNGPFLGSFKLGKDVLGQFVSVTPPVSPISFDNVKLSLNFTVDIQKEQLAEIKGCLVSPNGQLIFVDSCSSQIIILSSIGLFVKQIKVIPEPKDITLINESTAAVSTNGCIQIIDIISEDVKQEIKTNNQCYGISYHDGSLYWCEMAIGIQKMKLSTGNISTLIEPTYLSTLSYITLHRDKIYLADNDTITCYTLQGNTEWNFKFEEPKTDSRRITVDNNSNVYVTSYSGDSVDMISPDGERSRQLLSKKNGLQNPTGVYFDKTRSNLLIVNRRGTAQVISLH